MKGNMKKNIIILASLMLVAVGCESSRSDRDTMNEPSGAEMRSDTNQLDSSTNAPSTNSSPNQSETPQSDQQK